MPKISVIIPIFNTGEFLKKCLDSLCQQTFQDFELICVDDGSTDQSLEILKKYAADKPFIKVLTQPNQGQATARNAGIKVAEGEYISFIDSDDWVAPDFLEKLLDAMISYHVDLTECRLFKYKTSKKKKRGWKVVKNPLNTRYVRFSVCTKLYKASLIKDFPFLEGIYYEDYPWVITLLSRVSKMAVTDEPLYFYRYNPSSTTKSLFTPKKVLDYWCGLKFVFENFKQHDRPLSYLKKRLIPNILKSQLKLIEKENLKDALYDTFASELRWVKENGLLSWRYNWRRFLRYRQIMKR